MTKYPAVLSMCAALTACASSPPFSASNGDAARASGSASALAESRAAPAARAAAPADTASLGRAAASVNAASSAAHSDDVKVAQVVDVKVAQVVDVKDYSHRLVCRREEPLGTRIAHRHCFSPGDERRSANEEYLQREEFEQLRNQQANVELLRQQALRQSIQQRR
jgi:hypothetical protein